MPALVAGQIDLMIDQASNALPQVRSGTIKSSIGIGSLLWAGIGDTIRVSLSAEPEEEVRVGFEMLKALNLRAAAAPFAHGAVHQAGAIRLYDSYHCSRYNTNTGVLTPKMFRAVFAKIRSDLNAGD